MPEVAGHLVGRAAELAAIDAALTAVARGRAAALVLSGDPGIGKSRLLAELAGRADARGWLVLNGSASELEQDLPFSIFVDALDDYVASLEPRRIGEDVAADLAAVLPALSGAGRGAVEADRYRAHAAVRALLERLAVTAPLLLALDDVHWADDASVDLLAALVRRPSAAPVLLALASRPRQLPERLSRGLERAERHEAVTRLELMPLGRAEAAELLGDGVDADRADVLYAECGGNPFYLEQLARVSIPTHPHAGAEVELAGVGVPAAVRASLGEELALLSPPTRRVLEGAAVAGDPFEPELSAAAAGMDEPEATAPLDELLELGLVRATDVPRRFRFRHPLVRRAVYESAPAAWRLGAHERCAAALAGRGAPADARAHHVEHAGRRGDAAAVAVLAEAAEAVSRRAPASAAHWYGAALRLLPEDAPPEQRAHLLMARAAASAAIVRLPDAHADLVAAVELVPREATAWWIGLTVACAELEQLLGRHEAARGRLADALHRLPDPASPEAAAVMVQLAASDLFRARYASMRAWAERADEVARPLGDRSLRAATRAIVAMACAYGGPLAEADAASAEAAALLASLSEAELAGQAAAMGYLGAAELYLDRYDAAVAQADRSLAVQRATGHESPTLIATRSLAWIMQGRIADALQILDTVIEQRIRIRGTPQALAFHLVHRALACAAAGDVDAALSAAEEAFAAARGVGSEFISAWAGLSLAVALEAGDDPRRAEEVLLASAGGDEVPALQSSWRVLALALLTRCRLADDRRDDARRAAAVAETVARDMPLPMAVAWADLAAAALLAADGDPAAAAERALAAVAACEQVGAPIEAAAARVVAGQALAAAGDAAAAAAELERAATAFEAHGATRRRDAAERELRRLGVRVHRRTRRGSEGAGLEALTGRELEVAELVVDRRTNPEIAAELFLSLKTVETHLRNIFRKLGVSSRVELARAIERERRGA